MERYTHAEDWTKGQKDIPNGFYSETPLFWPSKSKTNTDVVFQQFPNCSKQLDRGKPTHPGGTSGVVVLSRGQPVVARRIVRLRAWFRGLRGFTLLTPQKIQNKYDNLNN